MPSNEVTVFEIFGTIFFASVYSFDELVPDYEEARNAVLLTHLRGRESLDETTVEFLEEFVPKLHAAGNQLMICGVTEPVLERLKVTEAYKIIGEDNIFPAQPIIGASMEEAWAAAEKWIEERQDLESAKEEDSAEAAEATE